MQQRCYTKCYHFKVAECSLLLLFYELTIMCIVSTAVQRDLLFIMSFAILKLSTKKLNTDSLA